MPRRLQEMQWLVSVSSVWHMAWCSSWSSSQIQLAHVAHCAPPALAWFGAALAHPLQLTQPCTCQAALSAGISTAHPEHEGMQAQCAGRRRGGAR